MLQGKHRGKDGKDAKSPYAIVPTLHQAKFIRAPRLAEQVTFV